MRILALLLVGSLAWCADSFPVIQAENLLGAKISLPEAAKGHPTVLVVGFTHAAQKQTLPWNERIRPQFPNYSIAVLEDAPRLVRPMALSGMKSSIPKNQHDRFLVMVHGEKLLKQAAGFDRPDDAYLVLLDRDGLVQWRFQGPVTDTAFSELRNKFAELEK